MNDLQDRLIGAAKFSPVSVEAPNAWCGHLPFAAWLIKLVTPAVFVELGTHSGNSYFSFCQAVSEERLPTKCYAVDTWEGEEHAGYYSGEVFQQVNAHNQARYADFSQLLRMKFDEAVSYFSDESIDLLHIDGLHTYEAVKHDFETWLPRLAPGAIVLFHDTMVRERGFGVWKLWEELQDCYPNNLEFLHSHGLGVLQIDGASEQKKLEWLQPSSPKQKELKDYFSALGTRQLERFELRQSINNVHILNQTVAERDGQIASLNQTVAERDGQIASLNQAVAEWDSQIANLNEMVEDRDGQIDGLNQTVTDLAEQFVTIKNSHSWKMTAPLRAISEFIKKKTGFFKKGPSAFLVLRYRFGIFRQNFRAKLLAKEFSQQNFEAIQDLSKNRFNVPLGLYHIPSASSLPEIDISVVLFNSKQWLSSFCRSLLNQSYPLNKINLIFVDHGSTDGTIEDLRIWSETAHAQFCSIKSFQQNNLGFGGGHHRAITESMSDLILIANVDLEFFNNTILNAVCVALGDHDCKVASWELRQIPYEHPKYYDPVTLETNWSSHACVLLRRKAYISIGGYDSRIFMYAEDVELSYRFRSYGYKLKYVPGAVVFHKTYEHAGQVKPLQYLGSALGNLYVRLRYGSTCDKFAGVRLYMRKLLGPSSFLGAKQLLLSGIPRIAFNYLHFSKGRGPKEAFYPFYADDYELIREGAFFEVKDISAYEPLPVISIIVRTYAGRKMFLKQALQSILNQTYPAIELIVSEDGGSTQQTLVEQIGKLCRPGMTVHFVANNKVGRCATGNAGLACATGEYIQFLDDDDLLFADHVEVLARTLLDDNTLDGAYSLAFEVETELSSEKQIYVEKSIATPAVFRQEWDYRVLQDHNLFPIQSILFCRALYKKWGGFNVDLDLLEDWHLWLRYGFGANFKYIPKTTSLYRVPADTAVKIQRAEPMFRSEKRIKQLAAEAIEEKTA